VKEMKLNECYEVEIIRLNNEGEGIAKISDFIVFVKNALIGEKLKIKITDVKKNYAKAEIIEILKKSNDREKPICPYFNVCGGCNLMHMNYEKQLEFKKDKIKSIFKKICHIDINLKDIYSFNSLNYRNKVVFKVKNDKIGFYKNKTNEIIDIDNCLISNEKINECLSIIRKFILENKNNDINEIMIRVCNNDVMIAIDNIKNKLKEEFINIFNKDIVKSIYINDKLEYGEKSLIQTVNGLNFKVSPKSFFQVNIDCVSNLYNYALKNIKKENTIVDLYSGTGTITLMLSMKCNNVIGIEVVEEAVMDAKNNMILNNINNVDFKCGKVEKVIDKIKNENIDILVMDPPRSGSDKKTLNDIINLKPKELIYISCNPVSLARDYNILKEYYELKEISAFDMFTNTYHVESVGVLERK
jgi:23S rRNA (uracil1939-C5)-methyltransferase